MIALPSIRTRRRLVRGDRWQLRRRHAYQPASAEDSGAKEWSDRELARLRPSWFKTFLGRYRSHCAFLVFLYLLALLFLGASFERYWHWLQSVEAVAGEPVRIVDRWTAHCLVKPWTRACRPVSTAGSREVIPNHHVEYTNYDSSGPPALSRPTGVPQRADAKT
jgi:hypothetical protein